jgi:hypothetical protein
MKTKAWMALWFGFMVVACGSCTEDEPFVPVVEAEPFPPLRAAGGVYTCYNLHYVSEMGAHRASYANWTDYPGHSLLPYNTKVYPTVVENRIYFIVADTGMRIDFEYNAGRMGMSAWRYLALITSPTPVVYGGLNDVDRLGIATGRALVGMTKQTVLIALGYPARHRTPSLEDSGWTYWKGRRGAYVVEFDHNGNVVRIVDE